MERINFVSLNIWLPFDKFCLCYLRQCQTNYQFSQGKTVLLNSVQEWLSDCFLPFFMFK